MLNRRGILAAVAAILFCTSISDDAVATPFQPGEFITYSQLSWGELILPGGPILNAHYDSVYASTSGFFEVGIPGAGGYSMLFSSKSALLAYLPSTGAPGSLNADLLDPLSSASGIFGGEVAALHLNIDFSDAGHTLGSLAVPFGDLVIHDLSELPQWNGLTVRQVVPQLDTLLGGGTTGYSLAVAFDQAFNLNFSFVGGEPSQWAQDHLALLTVPVPEPSTVALLAIGLLMLTALPFRRKSRG